MLIYCAYICIYIYIYDQEVSIYQTYFKEIGQLGKPKQPIARVISVAAQFTQ